MIKKEFSFTKYIIFILITSLMLINYQISAEELIPFKFEGKCGYLNSKLEIVIYPKYLNTNNFSRDGFAIVTSDNYSGIIDHTETAVFKIDKGSLKHIYGHLYYFFLSSNSKYIKKYNTQCGIINIKNKKIIIKDIVLTSRSGGYASEDGIIFISKDKKGFFFDFEGNRVLTDLNMIDGNSFFEKRASIINEKGEPQIIDMEGNVLGNLSFAFLGSKYSEGLIPAKTKDGTTGYVNRSGEFEFTIPFLEDNWFNNPLQAKNFSGGYALIKTENNPEIWRIINNKGKFVSDNIKVSNAGDFYEGIARVGIGHSIKIGQNKHGFINTSGEYLVEPIIELFEYNNFHNGYSQINYNFTKEGLINTNGKVIWSSNIMKGIIKEEEIK